MRTQWFLHVYVRLCSLRKHFERHYCLITKHPYFVFQLLVWPTVSLLNSWIPLSPMMLDQYHALRKQRHESDLLLNPFSNLGFFFFFFKFLSIFLDYLTTWSALTLFCSPIFPLFLQMDSKHLMVGNNISSQWNLVGLGLSGFTIPCPFLTTRDSCLWRWNSWISLSQ